VATQGFEYWASPYGIEPQNRREILTDSEAFVKGDAVVVTTGRITKAAAAATDIYGVIQQTVTATTDTYAMIKPAYNGVEWRCTYAGTPAAANIGSMSQDITDENTVNLDDVTGGPCTLLSYDTATTTCIVVFNDTVWCE